VIVYQQNPDLPTHDSLSPRRKAGATAQR
jgi:hypothetical protein